MSFEAIGPIVARLVDRVVTGEGSAPTLPVSRPKRTRTEARAKFRGNIMQEAESLEEAPASRERMNAALPKDRWEYAAVPKRGAPPLAAYCHLVLVVDNGPHLTRPHRSTPDLRVASNR